MFSRTPKTQSNVKTKNTNSPQIFVMKPNLQLIRPNSQSRIQISFSPQFKPNPVFFIIDHDYIRNTIIASRLTTNIYNNGGINYGKQVKGIQISFFLISNLFLLTHFFLYLFLLLYWPSTSLDLGSSLLRIWGRDLCRDFLCV